MFLKFPPILAGNGSTASYVVLLFIVALVVGVAWFVFKQLNSNVED